MGSKSAKAKIDKFYMSAHYGVSIGPVDEVTRIHIKEKETWRGRITANSSLYINKPDLFGGLLKEGGVGGYIDVMFGGPTQKVSSWLASKFGRTVDNSPGYRGMLSLAFRGASGRQGFYWTATTPYLGNIWVTVGRYPRQLNPAVSRIPRTIYDGSLSLFFVLDDSGSMDTNNRFSSMKIAVNHVLDNLPTGKRLDLGARTIGGKNWTKRNATSADVAAFRSWIAGLPSDAPDTNFERGMQGAVAWFMGGIPSGVGRQMMFFITDGEPNPANSDDAARAIALPMIERVVPVDIYTVNIDLQNTTAIAKLDNTPEDGLPVVSGSTADELALTMENALADTFDANPANVIYECVTDKDWGLGWDVSSVNVDSFLSGAQTLFDEQFGLSLQWTQASSVEDFVNDILDCIKGAIFTDPRTGKLTLRLIRNDYNVEDLPVLSPDNATLQNFSRKAWGETTNEMKVTWTNPDTEGEESVYSQDLGNIAMQGQVISDSKGYYGVRRADLAQQLANRELRQASAPLCSCEGTVDRSMWSLAPYDCVRLNWPEYGLDHVVMRVVDINYGGTGSSAIKLSLVEDIFSLPEVTFVAPPSGEWVNPEQPPEQVAVARVLPVPSYMAAQSGFAPSDIIYPDTMATLLVPTPGGGLTSDYTFEVEQPTPTGGTEWITVGEPRSFLGTAKLKAVLPRAADSVITLSDETGQLAQVNSFLLIGPADAAADTLELALVTDVDEVTGALTVMRGVLDTVPARWPAGTDVWVGDVDDFAPIPETLIAGQNVRFRVSGQGSVPVIFEDNVNSRPSRPLRPANVKINDEGFAPIGLPISGLLDVTWSHRNRTLEDTAVLHWTAGSTAPEAGVTYRVVGDAYDSSDNLLEADWVSEDAGSATQLTVDLSMRVMPVGTSYVSFYVEAVRDGEPSWQKYGVRVSLLNAPTNLTIELLE